MARIEKTKNGTYKSRVYLGRDETGKTVQKTVYGENKKELQKRASSLRADYAKMPGEIRLAEAVYKYVESRNDVSLYSPTTYTGYASNYRSLKTYVPDYMMMDMRTINSNDMEDLYRILSKHLSAKTLRNIRGLLSGAYKMAGIAPPELTDMSKRILTNRKVTVSVNDANDDVLSAEKYFPKTSDIIGVIKYASQHRPDLVTPIALSAFCSLRRSEICALRMSDFDIAGKTVTVSRAMVKTASGEYVYTDTKTFASRRTVPVPSVLLEHIKSQGTIYDKTPKSISDAWEHVIAGAVRENLAGGTFRFHDLRHFAAAWFLTSLHFDIRTCMTLGGWSNERTLLRIYAYVTSEAKEHAAENIDKYANAFLNDAGL